MSSVNDQRWRWCEQDRAIVSVESSTSSDQQQRRPDVRRNSVDMMAQPADDWQQNAGVALIQLQRLERSEQPGTGEQYRSDTLSWSCWVYIWHARVRRANEAPHVSAASGWGRTSGYHWPHELLRLTPVVACWWLPLEPRRRQRCSSRHETSQRHAPGCPACCPTKSFKALKHESLSGLLEQIWPNVTNTTYKQTGSVIIYHMMTSLWSDTVAASVAGKSIVCKDAWDAKFSILIHCHAIPSPHLPCCNKPFFPIVNTEIQKYIFLIFSLCLAAGFCPKNYSFCPK